MLPSLWIFHYAIIQTVLYYTSLYLCYSLLFLFIMPLFLIAKYVNLDGYIIVTILPLYHPTTHLLMGVTHCVTICYDRSPKDSDPPSNNFRYFLCLCE